MAEGTDGIRFNQAWGSATTSAHLVDARISTEPLLRHVLLQVVIPGQPVPQARPKVVRAHGRSYAYDPERSARWKEPARLLMAAKMQGRPHTGPVAVTIIAVFEHPKTKAPKWTWPTGDVDNVAKASMDAANGIAYEDDAQVMKLTVEKRYGAKGEQPRVEMIVEALGVEA